MSVRLFGYAVLMGSLAGAVACDREPDNRAEVEMREEANDAAGAMDRAGDRAENAADRTGNAIENAAEETGDAAMAAKETADIKMALASDDVVEANDIDVDTNGTTKVVTLTGRVETEAQKTRAEEIAKREATGYTVENRLTVGRDS